ncbi:MAG TPA: hypothetical protein VFR70_10355 [Flavobacterium sp.]|nr:hypothetical protein [Flavobacterium sp.]
MENNAVINFWDEWPGYESLRQRFEKWNSKGIAEVGIFQFSVLEAAKSSFTTMGLERKVKVLWLKSMGIKKAGINPASIFCYKK